MGVDFYETSSGDFMANRPSSKRMREMVYRLRARGQEMGDVTACLNDHRIEPRFSTGLVDEKGNYIREHGKWWVYVDDEVGSSNPPFIVDDIRDGVYLWLLYRSGFSRN